MPKKKTLILLFFVIFIPHFISSQEALKSVEEEYYNFLALLGVSNRPYLNYRTLSDSMWNIDETINHPWQQQNLSKWHNLFGDIKLRVYGPDLFMSGNTEAPYGNYDGVLWQGRGFNALLKGGVRAEGYGMELTLLPHFAFSQNAPFKIMKQDYYDSEYGYIWGYGKNIGADAPQRFGDEPFFDWDFGDSEIRYSWKTLTVGFGTQAIWLGPSYINPILHSNNAPAYPKFDIGLRRQKIILPWLGWYLGDVEARIWVGQLTASDYFSSSKSNKNIMIHGLSFAYSPSFLSGLTLFANRTCMAFWEWENLKYMFPSRDNKDEDQKATFGFSWVFPTVGFEVFGELGIDDHVPNGSMGYVRHPFHTTVYTWGLVKTVKVKPEKNIYGKIIFEFNWMEMTKDFFFEWHYSFYFHHQLTHGYTNRGQWLGNGVSPGGNSQYLSFVLYYPRGSSSLFITRNNPDNNFLYKNAIMASAENENLRFDNKNQNKANFNIGLSTGYFLYNNIHLSGGIVYNQIINPYYKRVGKEYKDRDNAYLHNISLQLALKFLL